MAPALSGAARLSGLDGSVALETVKEMVMQETIERTSVSLEGDCLLEPLRRLLYEGNVRRVIIRRGGHVIAEFPLAVGVVGVAMAPMLAAVGAITALASDCVIEVERGEGPDGPPVGSSHEPKKAAELEDWMKY
jgi:hypothetical protein